MVALKLGTTDASKVYVGGTPAKAVYLGSTKVWPTVALAAKMGMDKSGTQAVNPLASAVQVTGWVARSGFTGTVITSNKLVPAGAGNTIIYAKLTTGGGGVQFGKAMTVELMQNNIVVKTGTIPQLSSAVTLTDTAVTLVAGDVIWLRYSYNGTATGLSITAGATATYVYFDDGV